MAARMRWALVGAAGALAIAGPGVALAGDDDQRRGGDDRDPRACGDRADARPQFRLVGRPGGGFIRVQVGRDARDELQVVGITEDAKLICFDEDRPDRARTIGTITGLSQDARIVGIDYRPASGADGDQGDLYGLGDQGGVYVIDARTAVATLRSRLSVPLAGTSFGVDFNPVVDRLRVVSDTGQNLRANVDTGETIVDGPLTNPGPPVAGATGVTGVAYTNNDSDPNTATTLYAIDTMLDQLSIQAPANAGSLSGVGKLRVDAGTSVGWDVYSKIRRGTTVDLEVYATLTVGGRVGFYELELFSGRAELEGYFHPSLRVTGMAMPLNQL